MASDLHSHHHLRLAPALLLVLFLAACSHERAPRTALDITRDSLLSVLDSIRVVSPVSPDDALSRLATLQPQITQLNDETVTQAWNRRMAHALVFGFRADSAVAYIDEAMAHARRTEDHDALMDAFVIKGLQLTDLGQDDSALTLYDEAFRIADPVRDSMYLGSLLANKANIFSRRGDFRQATKLYLESVRNSIARGEERSLATVYGNLAIEYGKLREYDSSVTYFQRAIAINTRLGGRTDVARDLVNLGVTYKEQEQYATADSAFQESLAIARALGLQQLIAQNLLNIGNVAARLHRLDEADAAFHESMEICRREGITYGIMLNKAALGALHGTRGRHREGIAMLHEALATARDLQVPNEENSILEDLSKAYEEAGDAKNALTYLRAWITNQSSTLGVSGEDAVKRLEAELDLERRNHENELLRTENTISALAVERQRTLLIAGAVILALLIVVLLLVLRTRRTTMRTLAQLEEKNHIIEQTSERLAESNQLKELLLDVITHDLISPLSTIRGSAEMLQEDPANRQLVDIIVRSSTQVGAVAMNASALSRVAINETIPMEDLALAPMIDEVLDECAIDLARLGMEVERVMPPDLHLHANPVLIEVFRNYVGNAIRHAHEGRRLRIDAFRTDEGTTIRVADFARTIPPEQREAIFHRRVQLHAAPSIGSGLGLAIVRRIALAHGGAAWVEPNTPTGNIFCIRIPNDSAAAG